LIFKEVPQLAGKNANEYYLEMKVTGSSSFSSKKLILLPLKKEHLDVEFNKLRNIIGKDGTAKNAPLDVFVLHNKDKNEKNRKSGERPSTTGRKTRVHRVRQPSSDPKTFSTQPIAISKISSSKRVSSPGPTPTITLPNSTTNPNLAASGKTTLRKSIVSPRDDKLRYAINFCELLKY